MEDIVMPVDNPYVLWVLSVYTALPWVGLLILMMFADVISGVVAAIYERRLSSKIGYRGMMKKVACLIVLGVAALIDRAMMVMLPEDLRNAVTFPLAKLTAGFFLFNEAISVLENCKRAGVPLPAFLTKSLIDTVNRLSHYGEAPKGQDETVSLAIKSAKIEAVVHHEPEK